MIQLHYEGEDITIRNFSIEEFFSRAMLNQWGERRCLQFIDPKTLILAQAYRDFFEESMFVNTWNISRKTKKFSNRGFRPPTSTVGASFSQHKFGRAFDCHFHKLSVRQAYKEIMDNQLFFMNFGLTTLEDIDITKTWLHSDSRYTGLDNILIVKP